MQRCRGARRRCTAWAGIVFTLMLAGCGQLRQSVVEENVRAEHKTPQTPPQTNDPIKQTGRPPTLEEQATIQQLEHRFTKAVSAGNTMESSSPIADPTLAQPVPNQGTAEPVAEPAPGSPQDPATGVKESFTPTTLTDPQANLAKIKEIVERSTRFYEENPKYTCRITRRERVGGKVLPQETMAMNFRLEPRSVYYKWLDEENQGREMVYVDGKYDGKIITLGGRNDFLMTGKRIKVDPTGFLAKKNGRYPISDSGTDRMLTRLSGQITNQEKGIHTHGVLRYMGTVVRKENFGPMDYFVHEIPKGFDHAFPDGGVRHWYFDQKTARQVLLHAEDLKGEFLEYYLFDRFLPNPALEERDFDPDYLWPKKTASTEPEKNPARLAVFGEQPPK